MPDLLIHKLDDDLPDPGYAHPGDAGLDLRTREAITLGPGERTVVPTGIAVAIPAGHVGMVCPRSGLAARHGITVVNAPGIVDAGYRGEVKVVLANTDPATPIEFVRGDRIAQLVIVPVAAPTVHSVDALDDTERGSGGFGSTGT